MINNFRDRIVQLAGKIKKAQMPNIERGSYYESPYDTIGNSERVCNPGDYGGSPAQPSRPPLIFNDERIKRKKYPRCDNPAGFVSHDGPQGAAEGSPSTAQPYAIGGGEGGSTTVNI